MTINLLQETLQDMQSVGQSPDTVAWVGSRDGKYASPWADFAALAKDCNYDNGYGSQEIGRDLVVVFRDNSWLARHEYDGSEYWVYQQLPQPESDAQPLKIVRGTGCWVELKALHDHLWCSHHD